MIRFLILVFEYTFYRVKWKDLKEGNNRYTGYFKVKRKWIWIIFFPFILAFYFLYEIYNFFSSLNGFTYHWIQSDKKEKLSFKQRVVLLKRLR